MGFKCATSSACRHLWRYSVEQRIFFTFSSSAEIPAVVTGGSFFSRGSKVRYSGRVERELAEDVVSSSTEAGSRASRSQREAYASRRSTSEPIRDFDEDEEECDDDLSFDNNRRHRSIERNATRQRRDDMSVPGRRHHHDQDGSSAISNFFIAITQQLEMYLFGRQMEGTTVTRRRPAEAQVKTTGRTSPVGWPWI